MYGLDADSGTLVWDYVSMGRSVHASPAIHTLDGVNHIVLSTVNGDVFSLTCHATAAKDEL